MNKTEYKAIAEAVKSGFTFTGDSIFSTFAQAKRALNSLARKGYLEAETDKEGRTQYLPTKQAIDFIKYGIED